MSNEIPLLTARDFEILRTILEATGAIYNPELLEKLEAGVKGRAVCVPAKQEVCSHRIIDARNSVVKSGYVCIDCYAIFAAADHDYRNHHPAPQPVNQQLLEALKDMFSGWRYIRESHGDLYGVGWDRCEASAKAAIAAAESEPKKCKYRVSVHAIYDCLLFHPLSGNTPEEIVEDWIRICGEERAGKYGAPYLLGDVILLEDSREIRRVGASGFLASKYPKPQMDDPATQRWIANVRADADVMAALTEKGCNSKPEPPHA